MHGVIRPTFRQSAFRLSWKTIHPFIDGNGRVGRALIAMVLRRRKLTSRSRLLISLVLATRADAYIAGLTATRYAGRADTATAALGYDTWIETFAAACRRAASASVPCGLIPRSTSCFAAFPVPRS